MQTDEVTVPDSAIQPFNRLRANVKVPVDIEIAGCTAVVGGNRVGKTSVMDTVRLALTGKHPIGGNPSDLFELMPPGALTMDAVMSGPSGAVHFQLEAPDGKALRPSAPTFKGGLATLTETERGSILALNNIGEMLRYGTARMREALMVRFGTSREVPTPLGINSKQTKLWEEGKAETVTVEPSDHLAAMAKWFRSQARKKNADAKSIEAAIERRKAQLEGISGGTELLPEYQKKLVQATAWENGEGLRTRKATLESLLDDLREEARQLLERDTRPIPEKPEDRTPYRAALQAAHDVYTKAEANHGIAEQLLTLVERSGASQICPMCTSQGADLKGMTARFDKIRIDRLTEMNRASADIERYEIILDDLNKDWHDYEMSMSSPDPLEAEKASLKSQADKIRAELEGVQAGLVDVPPTYDGASADELKKEIDRIKELELTRKKLFHDSEDMHLLRESAETCKVLERESAKILKELLKNVQSTAEACINKYMPTGFVAALIITDKAVEWRVIGTDGKAHKRGGMCGSEFGSLMVAVACAWTEGSPLRVILLDDVDFGAFDPENFAELLNALRAAQQRGDVTQVIIGWNRPNEIPEGWHVVKMGA